MDITYKKNEMMAYKIAVQMEQIIKKDDVLLQKEYLVQLSDIEKQLQTRKFRMAVVGEFNRGKTSFINVLLGKRILPEDVVATTATFNRITYGETPKAYLVMKDGSRDNQEIPVDELADYVTKLTEQSAKKAAEIQEAVVEYPTMLCYNDVDLIDTPGMNDADDMNAVTVNRLEDIDLAVVAINAEYPYSETENKFVVKLLESKNICQIIFVITHFDMIRDREKKRMTDFLVSRIKNNVLDELNKNYEMNSPIYKKYHKNFDFLQIYGVSSIDGMEALETNDRELYEESGFLRLMNELPQVILSSKSIHMIDNIVTRLEEIIDNCSKFQKKRHGERNRWGTLKEELNDIFSSMIWRLESSLENEIADENIKTDIERQKEYVVSLLLQSLGKARSVTLKEIKKCLLPVMEQEFKRINEYFQQKEKQLLKEIYEEKWPFILDSYISLVNEKMCDYPKLRELIQPSYSQLFSLTSPGFIAQLCAGESTLNEIVFYWVESPIQAVLSTVGNQSVLPGIKRIIDLSMEECFKNMENNMKADVNGRLRVIESIYEEFLQAIEQSCTEKDNSSEDMSIIKELEELKIECKLLHTQIGLEI